MPELDAPMSRPWPFMVYNQALCQIDNLLTSLTKISLEGDNARKFGEYWTASGEYSANKFQ